MKYHIQFFTKDLKGRIVEALGSDSVFILDGRNSINTMIQDGIAQANRLKAIQPYYIKFEVRQGNIKHNHTIATYNLKKINGRYK